MVNDLDESCGIIPRAVFDIFAYVRQQREEGNEIVVRLSFLQIYMECITDLLNPDKLAETDTKQASSLPIREDPEYGVYVDGLTQVRSVRRLHRFNDLTCCNGS